MRITRDILLKAARTVVQQRTLRDKHILCVYLTGSVIDDLPLLGGAADIDLVFVHDQPPPQPREIIRLTPDVHLDLAHHDQSLYNQPRELRINPWIGSFLLKDPIVLYGTQHWFEFIQASVHSTFYQPETILQRALPMAEKARQTWLDFQLDPQDPDPDRIWQYLQSLELAANSLAVLKGVPLTERRFMLQFPGRVAELGYPGMASGLVDLVAPKIPETSTINGWIADWKATLSKLGQKEDCPLGLHPIRHGYYTRAVEALTEDQPSAALWIMLHTWTRAITSVDPDPESLKTWTNCLTELEIYGEHFERCMNNFDQFLDQVEEIIEKWADYYGIDTAAIQ
jgi:hypothetical protein